MIDAIIQQQPARHGRNLPLMLRHVGAIAMFLVLVATCVEGAPPTLVPPQTAATDIAGTYGLTTVNGNKVPYALSPEPGAPTVNITSGTFTIKSDGTCSSRMVFVLPSGEGANQEVGGSYTRDGSKLTIQWQGAGQTTGTIQGDTFTMDNEGVVFAYKKKM
jgi:hypothetical protein